MTWRENAEKRLLRDLGVSFPQARGYPVDSLGERTLREFANQWLLALVPDSPLGVGFLQVRYLISSCVARHLFRHLQSPVTSVGVHARLWMTSHIKPTDYARGRVSVGRSAKR